ncbi:MAG: hypothetical protein RR547_00565, partial [Raoultibacter sp.]
MAGNEDFFEYTNNLNLRLILSGANLDIEDLNYNPKKIDGWPQIIETGGNDDLKYLKFSNGMYIMYGRGTDDQLNCNKQVVSAGAMYKSENSTVVFPIT